MRREPLAIQVGGEPLAAAVAALRLLQDEPGLAIFIDIDELAICEGDVFPLDLEDRSAIAAIQPLLIRQWPAFLAVRDSRIVQFDRCVGLVDPVQCLAELDRLRAGAVKEAPDGAIRLVPEGLPPITRSSQMIMHPVLRDLALPLLYEPLGPDAYRQYLPLGEGLIMVRERQGPPIHDDGFFINQQKILGVSQQT